MKEPVRVKVYRLIEGMYIAFTGLFIIVTGLQVWVLQPNWTRWLTLGVSILTALMGFYLLIRRSRDASD